MMKQKSFEQCIITCKSIVAIIFTRIYIWGGHSSIYLRIFGTSWCNSPQFSTIQFFSISLLESLSTVNEQGALLRLYFPIGLPLFYLSLVVPRFVALFLCSSPVVGCSSVQSLTITICMSTFGFIRPLVDRCCLFVFSLAVCSITVTLVPCSFTIRMSVHWLLVLRG